MNLEEIEEKARYAFMNAKDVTLSKDEFNSLIAEVKRLRAEIDERYLCPECGYTWSVEDDERLEGMIEDREGE